MIPRDLPSVVAATSTHFDHLILDEATRALMRQACDGSGTVYLAPLIKGLSGARVWLANWIVFGTRRSGLHIFKVGKLDKLQAEYDNWHRASFLEGVRLPKHVLIKSEETLALLSQEFVGDRITGEASSLLDRLCKPRPAQSTRTDIEKLFLEQMKGWYGESSEHGSRVHTFGEEFEKWFNKLDLESVVDEIGRTALQDGLAPEYGDNALAGVFATVESLRTLTTEFSTCIVHGDLHCENILVDQDGEFHLIDFGWTGERWRLIDFLMMECSLKFRVAPPQSPLGDLVWLERFLEAYWDCGNVLPEDAVTNRLFAPGLHSVMAGVDAVRDCAFKLGVLVDKTEYRRGLIVLTACLASLPHPINRLFLIHSLAHHASLLRKERP